MGQARAGIDRNCSSDLVRSARIGVGGVVEQAHGDVGGDSDTGQKQQAHETMSCCYGDASAHCSPPCRGSHGIQSEPPIHRT
jgi:hypothetical protein